MQPIPDDEALYIEGRNAALLYIARGMTKADAIEAALKEILGAYGIDPKSTRGIDLAIRLRAQHN